MKVYIIPETAQGFNDYLSLEFSVSWLLDMARHFASTSVRTVDMSLCVLCKRQRAVEVHHIKPLWACSLEYVLKYNPQRHKDLTWGSALPHVETVEQVVKPWSTKDNLIALCKACHRRLGKKGTQQWRGHFEQYNVIFGNRKVPKFWDQGRRFCGYP